MQLGSMELQIFVALILVLGSAFVALVCDFLKGNNEQLRERNIELRVRQDERERLGLFEPLAHPIAWLQGLAALARNPGLVEKVAAPAAAPAPAAAAAPVAAYTATEEPSVEPAAGAVPAAADLTAGAADRNPQRRHRYDEFKMSAKGQTWATKEELEQLAGRAARIRARHEASQKKPAGFGAPVKPESEVVAPAPVPAPAETRAELRPELRPELLKPVRESAAVAPLEFPVRPVETPAVLEEAKPAPAITPMEVIAGLPPQSAVTESSAPAAAVAPPVPAAAPEAEVPREEPAAPAIVEAAPSLSEMIEPPMASRPAPAPWQFRPISEDRPRAIEIPVAAASTSLGVLKPGASALLSTFSGAEAPAPVTEALEEEPIAAALAIEPEPGETLFVTDQPMAEAPMSPLAAVASEIRTRIHPVEVPALAEAATEDLSSAVPPAPEPVAEEVPAAAAAAPSHREIPLWRVPLEAPEPAAAAQAEPEIPLWREPVGPPSGIAIDIEPEDLHFQAPVRQPVPVEEHAFAPRPAMAPVPVVEARPVETSIAGHDVAALQKATGLGRPAAALPGSLGPGAGADGEAKLDLPPGLHESAVLSHLLENQTPFSGVVVAIGLNDYDSLREKLAAGNDSVAALSRMVLSMLRAQDFACRFQEDEYILIYPGERGSSAQRRLFQVSEKLWDFQLRSLGNLSVMFSWGGLEVTNETLAEAVASARERMYQTKRNRKPASLDLAASRKKVVNG